MVNFHICMISLQCVYKKILTKKSLRHNFLFQLINNYFFKNVQNNSVWRLIFTFNIQAYNTK